MKTKIDNVHSKPSDQGTIDSSSKIIADSKQFFKKAAEKKIDDEGNEIPEEGPAPIGNIGDIISDSKIWEWAGISFGEYELMLL